MFAYFSDYKNKFTRSRNESTTKVEIPAFFVASKIQ
jgi:hypothetical protein